MLETIDLETNETKAVRYASMAFRDIRLEKDAALTLIGNAANPQLNEIEVQQALNFLDRSGFNSFEDFKNYCDEMWQGNTSRHGDPDKKRNAFTSLQRSDTNIQYVFRVIAAVGLSLPFQNVKSRKGKFTHRR